MEVFLDFCAASASVLFSVDTLHLGSLFLAVYTSYIPEGVIFEPANLFRKLFELINSPIFSAFLTFPFHRLLNRGGV